MGLLEAMMWAFGGGKVAGRGVKGGFFEVFLQDFDTFLSRFFLETTVCESCILLIFKY